MILADEIDSDLTLTANGVASRDYKVTVPKPKKYLKVIAVLKFPPSWDMKPQIRTFTLPIEVIPEDIKAYVKSQVVVEALMFQGEDIKIDILNVSSIQDYSKTGLGKTVTIKGVYLSGD